jgi:hypothetical protein
MQIEQLVKDAQTEEPPVVIHKEQCTRRWTPLPMIM